MEQFLPWKTQNFSNPKHIAHWGMSLRTFTAPLAQKPLDQIGREDILALWELMWETKHISASRLRGRLENLFDHAIQNGAYTRDNPARWSLFNATLSAPRKLTGSHRPAMPRRELPAFAKELRSSLSMGALTLEFLILTAAGSGEVRLAKWPAFDHEAKLWHIPAERMKMRCPHTVPLSDRTLEILQTTLAVRLSDATPDGYVFEGSKMHRPMSDMTIRAVMRRMDKDEFVPHGFRSTFRDWAGSETDFPRELAEEALVAMARRRLFSLRHPLRGSPIFLPPCRDGGCATGTAYSLHVGAQCTRFHPKLCVQRRL